MLRFVKNLTDGFLKDVKELKKQNILILIMKKTQI